jgi:hypothetical protein
LTVAHGYDIDITGGSYTVDRDPDWSRRSAHVNAAVFQGEGVLSIPDRPEPGLRSPTDVLVRVLACVLACGICPGRIPAGPRG